jgi:hypothetical protein
MPTVFIALYQSNLPRTSAAQSGLAMLGECAGGISSPKCISSEFWRQVISLAIASWTDMPRERYFQA